MCISVIYGPINQPARHRGNNSAAGKKEQGLAWSCENRGTEGGGGEEGGRKSSFPPDRNFIHARAFVSRVQRPHSEGTMCDNRIYWLLLLLSRERHFAPDVYMRVKQSPAPLFFFCRQNPRLFFRLINHRDIFIYADRRVAYLNSNRDTLGSMHIFFHHHSFNLDVRHFNISYYESLLINS